jgi:hypothetical protein
VHAALASVPPPRPFDLNEYLARVSQARGHRLVLQEEDLPVDLCGVWRFDGHTDHIYVPRGAAGSHRWQIIAHEVGHMLMAPEGVTFGHGIHEESREQLPPAATDWLREMFPHMDQEVLARYFARTHYEEEGELHAELYGTLAIAGVHVDDRAIKGRIGRIRQAMDGL